MSTAVLELLRDCLLDANSTYDDRNPITRTETKVDCCLRALLALYNANAEEPLLDYSRKEIRF